MLLFLVLRPVSIQKDAIGMLRAIFHYYFSIFCNTIKPTMFILYICMEVAIPGQIQMLAMPTS